MILAELFDALGIEQMRMAEGALRDGLLYDMVGRLTDEDPRERTVGSMQRRYHVDTAQAERVEATALTFLEQVAEAWELEDENAELVLKWAARLHEIGLDVAHSGYHRHGAYLLENADLPGFAREEQLLLARLVGAHRRKPILTGVEDLIPPWDRLAIYLIALLRLAVLLHRGRSTTALPRIELSAQRPHAGNALSGALAQGSRAVGRGSAPGDRAPARAGPEASGLFREPDRGRVGIQQLLLDVDYRACRVART